MDKVKPRFEAASDDCEIGADKSSESNVISCDVGGDSKQTSSDCGNKKKLLNSEERLKLMRYQRYFRCASLGVDECISKVHKLRKRLIMQRQKTLSILDEDGFPESSKER